MIGDGENLIAPRPRVGLYIHVPYCESKCGYCDFYSVPKEGRDQGPLVQSLISELTSRVAALNGDVRSVFFGGGTPTLLDKDLLTNLLDAIRRSVDLNAIEEFTVEANPATVNDEIASLLAASGVTRVSMGAQSFHPAELETLERIHNSDDIVVSVATLRRHGITNINLDLIFGIPGQTMKTWDQSIDLALDLNPNHLACYGLTYEPGTKLTAQRKTGKVTPCDESLEAEMYQFLIDKLASAGFEQYETSNFAKPGARSIHNLIYWRNEPYIGVGPSAAGCIDGRRYKNASDINKYVTMMAELGHAEAESETLSKQDLTLEMLLMQFRLIEGLSIQSFKDRIGEDPLKQFDAVLPPLVQKEFVTVSSTHIALTRKGRLISDAIVREFARACDVTLDTPLPLTA